MNNIIFAIGGYELLDDIAHLWLKLNKLHREVSTHFSHQFAEISFEKRKKHFNEKSSNDNLRVEIARNRENSEPIGYCISSIKDTVAWRFGEIESLYLEPEFRKLGIGAIFMENSLDIGQKFSPRKFLLCQLLVLELEMNQL